MRAKRAGLLLALCGLIGACGKPCDCASGANQEADHARAPELDEQRRMLSQGYSMLYIDSSKVELSELILAVKVESDAFDRVIRDLSAFGGELKDRLEQIARDYPGVRIDLDPLPEIEKRKRRAIGMDRARHFAPVVGTGGREYERTMLISMANAINHERHLCEVMAKEEPDPQLKTFLLETERRFGALYEQAVALLDDTHFQDPKGKSPP